MIVDEITIFVKSYKQRLFSNVCTFTLRTPAILSSCHLAPLLLRRTCVLVVLVAHRAVVPLLPPLCF